MQPLRTTPGKVYITGAGPGDPELLTVKALRVVQQADVILYDRLTHPDLLLQAKPGCQQVYVGKEDGQHLYPQEEINVLLKHYAYQADTVVRLKGGDPFLFGRGGEEALFLAEHGIPFEIIPGVTSAFSVPAYAGIPVTHRGIAAFCTIVTGHLAKNGPDTMPWHTFHHNGTLIFLMSVARRQYIAQKLIEAGRSPQELVAFIEKGTTSQQRVITSTLQEVATHPPDVESPAIFLVGDVVQLHEKIQWFAPESSAYFVNDGASFPQSGEHAPHKHTTSDA